MKHKILLSLAACFVLAAVACNKDDDATIPVLRVTQATVSATGGAQNLQLAATSSWKLSVVYSGEVRDWVHLAAVSGGKTSGLVSVRMEVDANEGEGPRQAALVLKGDKYSTTATILQTSKSAGGAPLWLELPETNKPSQFFFSHDLNGDRYVNSSVSGTRNWSFYWDPDNYVSSWVAYPLNRGLLEGSYGRYDDHGGDFIPDPILTELGMRQPNLYGHSYGGGWTRGHQIPSADRQQEKSNISTFYVTNMTPQQYDFNGGIWGRLEGRVRTYARNSDTLYVCTGCHITDESGWSGDRGGMNVRVPSGYYKALLRLKGGNYTAAAFYLPHSASIADGDYMDYILSVDDLETQIGVDLFANLPSVLGATQANAIESAEPAAVVAGW